MTFLCMGILLMSTACQTEPKLKIIPNNTQEKWLIGYFNKKYVQIIETPNGISLHYKLSGNAQGQHDLTIGKGREYKEPFGYRKITYIGKTDEGPRFKYFSNFLNANENTYYQEKGTFSLKWKKED